jgi:hypothetical protein
LDQFLEDLLDIGIPPGSLVRLGGKSTQRTGDLSLRNQTPVGNLGKADWKIIDSSKAEAEIHANSLNMAFKQYLKSTVHDEDIMGLIEFEDDKFFQAFSVPSSADEMTIVGKGGKAIDEYYLLNQWSNNWNAGVFKEHPHVLNWSEIWGMSSASRQAQLAKWKATILKDQVEGVCLSAKLYDRCQVELLRKFEERNVGILRNKRIIGCTTTGAAKYKDSIQGASPDILLVEEAGEILESHVITALGADAKQMILIGDHKYVIST